MNVLLAATAAEGTTVIESAATEPEIEDLVNFLKAMGADIQGGGTSRLVIQGGKKLMGVTYAIIPDRVEAGTFMTAAAITGGEVTLTKVTPSHLSDVTRLFKTVGVKVEEGKDWMKVTGSAAYKPADVRVAPYPGFPTDMQAQVMALLAVVPGLSVITETIWENRFMHVFELNRMGADIKIEEATRSSKACRSSPEPL